LSDRFLLDTHTWIWIALDTSRLRPNAREQLKAERSPLSVSALSIYEAAVLSRRGRIDLDMPLKDWFDLAFADASLRLLPATLEIALDAAMLPDGFHGDPIDRLIAATARVHDMVLCTHDEKLV
jgi:PIN domain nuclease of toxin-antitoxin system